MLPSELSFYIGPTEFQNTFLPYAQEYVVNFQDRWIHLSNQLIVASTGFEPVNLICRNISTQCPWTYMLRLPFRHLALFVDNEWLDYSYQSLHPTITLDTVHIIRLPLLCYLGRGSLLKLPLVYAAGR